MDVRDNFPERKLTFTLGQDDPEILEKLSFVHLVQMKFFGDELLCASYLNEGNDPYIQIALQFNDWLAANNAKEHCDQHLDSSGAVVTSYKGALRYADGGSRMARDLRKRALANQQDG